MTPQECLQQLSAKWRHRCAGGSDDSDVAIEQCADELDAEIAAMAQDMPIDSVAVIFNRLTSLAHAINQHTQVKGDVFDGWGDEVIAIRGLLTTLIPSAPAAEDGWSIKKNSDIWHITYTPPLAGQREDVGDWRIDTSAGGPILVHKNCSVIEGEQAAYVLRLIEADRISDFDALFAAYKRWPHDLRKKLSLHDLRRMAGWRPATRPASDAVVDDAMVDRACDAFLMANPAAHTVGFKEMRAALTAALTSQQPGGSDGH